jgi:hypothetical protein
MEEQLSPSHGMDIACAANGSVIEKDKEVCFRRWPISSARASGKQKAKRSEAQICQGLEDIDASKWGWRPGGVGAA